MTGYLNAVGVMLNNSASPTQFLSAVATGQTLTGISGNDALYGNGTGDTLIGGSGDDTYVVLTSKDLVVEGANGGNDTVKSYAPSYTLTANVENLIVGGQGWYGGGNAQDNILTATVAGVTLDGGAGNDVLVGNTNTTFVETTGNGSDIIYNWNTTDTIRLGGYGLTSFSQVQQIASQQGANVVLNFTNGEKLVLAGTTLSSLSASNFELQVNTSKMHEVFDDEFNTLNLWNPVTNPTGTWRDDFGYGGYGTINSRTLPGYNQIYMDPSYAGTGKAALGIDPFSISNGVLSITASPLTASQSAVLGGYSWSSGLITTKQSFSMEYGYFEARVKMPAGQGLWPAFWLLPSNNTWPPELDIFEQLGKDPNTIYMTSHFNTTTVVNGQVQNKLNIDTTQWHTYGVDWEKDYITYYVDGVAVAKQPTPADMNTEMYMLLNMTVGGSWGGAPNATTPTNAQMQIDYVHAYATSGTVSMTVDGVHTVLTPGTSQGSSTPTTPPTHVAPVANADAFSATEGTALTVKAATGVLANDTHDAALTATAAVKTGPTHGTLALAADGSFVYTPTAGYHGADSFTYTETDSSGATATATATLNVAQVLPNAVNDSGFTAAYATPLTINAAALIANDTISTGYALSVTSVSNATGGTVSLSNGVVTFTPNAYYTGAASFTYTVADAYGDAASATVSLTVAAETRPTSTYIYGSANQTIDKHLSSYGWQIKGGANDTIYGGAGSNSLNGEAGHDTLVGGKSNDVITGGVGDTMTGGGGADSFVFHPGDLAAYSATGNTETITDFITTATAPSQHDVLDFSGFSKSATLTYTSTLANGAYLYHLADGGYSGDLIFQTGGHKLTSSDYLFMSI